MIFIARLSTTSYTNTISLGKPVYNVSVCVLSVCVLELCSCL